MSDSGRLLDCLRAQFARMDSRFDRLERKVDELALRLGALEVAVGELLRKMRGHS